MLEAGVRDVRNQGVLMRGVNDQRRRSCSTSASRCRTGPMITPYYFYMCDMIPFSRALAGVAGDGAGAAARRSWATCPASRRRGSSATSRSSASAGCTRSTSYDRERGISYWTKNYRTVDRGRRRRGADRATTRTTTRSTRCPRRARRGGGRTRTPSCSTPRRCSRRPPAGRPPQAQAIAAADRTPSASRSPIKEPRRSRKSWTTVPAGSSSSISSGDRRQPATSTLAMAFSTRTRTTTRPGTPLRRRTPRRDPRPCSGRRSGRPSAAGPGVLAGRRSPGQR